ncbi:MAG TPA: DUF5916 domain-containing protein, partial [Vicinamibacteria bacterium]|nr:DUF5916 domain-containing protein [Vicinamibacteria bacterium]
MQRDGVQLTCPPRARPSRRARAAGMAALLAALPGPVLAGAAPERPSVPVLRIDTPIEIDGRLDEEPWARAQAVTRFVQQDPDVGQPASERTEVRVLLDREALYFGIHCFSRRAADVIARELRRDNDFRGDDRFEIVLDTFHDHRNALHFVINPRGTQYDAQITDEGKDVNAEWDERWSSETTIDDRGWHAEVRIPLTAVRSRAGADAFGVNFARYIRHRSELALWTAWDRDFDLRQVSQAGHLTGLAGARTGLKLRVKPYLLGGFRSAAGDTDPERDLGLEVAKFSLTSGLTAEVTVNTDFAQTEVDQAIVNLTRFPTFFPEKREFFLERAGIFEFGLGGRRGGENERNLTMYYSRRIGLTEDRREVPLIAGAKVIGRAGGFDLGLLNVQTGSRDDAAAANYTVFRAKRNVLARSNLGAFFSNRQSAGDDHNRVAGADLNLTIRKNTDIQAFVARSFTPGVEGDSWVGRAKFNWYTDLYEVFLEHLYIGPEFRHDLGYFRRSDVRRTNAIFVWEPRPKLLERWVRYNVFRADLAYTTSTASRLLTREQIFRSSTRFQSDDSFRVQTLDVLDRLHEPFEVSDGIRLPPGEYHYRENFAEIEGSLKRLVGGRVRYTFGGFYSGTRRAVELTPAFHPSPHLSVEVGYEHNDVDLPGGAFTT